ncbi:hypothetical protein FSARC_10929 [Fusarium sarcochroum]|uniref:Uncharacterized protein n=1 Tax=Fusarium sarcochroum TaxID=1208366 RepID=A0A8H4TIP3_9HYPO|nr:hypothetical protein FSARC_10929 [Fusarium sarcochroum]
MHHLLSEREKNKAPETSTAKGSLSCIIPGKLIAAFLIDGTSYTYNMTINPVVRGFKSDPATLTYEDLNQLDFNRSHNGKIGPGAYKIQLDNGVVIEGDLEFPGLDVEFPVVVEGTGAWEVK